MRRLFWTLRELAATLADVAAYGNLCGHPASWWGVTTGATVVE